MVIKKKNFFYKSIKFKKISKKDIEQLRKERNLHFVRSKMLSQKIISKNDQHKWFKKIHKSKVSRYFSIFDNQTLIGSLSIKKIDKINKNCTWGFYIFKKFKGIYGPIVEYKILELVFQKLKMNKLYGYTLSNNLEILKLHKFFGFKREGLLKQHVLINNKKYDVIITSLFLKDWKKIKNKIFK